MKSLKLVSCAMAVSVIALSACQPMQSVEVRPVYDPQLEASGQETQDYYAVGKSYLSSSDYGRAIDAFRKSMRADDKNIAALNGLAISYDMLKRFDLSQKYYQKALDIDPQSSVTLSNLSYSLHAQGDHKEAVQVARAAESAMSEDDKQKDEIPPVIAANITIAEETVKMELEASQKPIKEEYYTDIEQTGARKWEVVQKKILPPRKPMIRKASFSVDEIVDRAEEKPKAQTKAQVKEAAPRRHAYKILNGTGRPQMAKRMIDFMSDGGLRVWAFANASNFSHEKSVISFMPGHREDAEKMAALLLIPVEIKEADDLKADVELILGQDLLPFDLSLHNKSYEI